MKIKTSDLTDRALNYAVARCLGEGTPYIGAGGKQRLATCDYAGDWAQGGPIIDLENIDIYRNHTTGDFGGCHPKNWVRASGATRLIAAMRCFVASKLGDEVEIPEELT